MSTIPCGSLSVTTTAVSPTASSSRVYVVGCIEYSVPGNLTSNIKKKKMKKPYEVLSSYYILDILLEVVNNAGPLSSIILVCVYFVLLLSSGQCQLVSYVAGGDADDTR